MKLYVQTFARATTFSLLALLLAPAAARADSVLYSDGAINGNLGSAFIDFTDQIADSFVLSSAATLSSVTVGLWSSETDDAPLRLDWSIWNAPGPGGIGGVVLDSGTGATLSDTFLFDNGDSDDAIYQSSFSLPSVLLGPGTYWLELQNGVNTNGDALLWDLNNGPSQTWDNLSGIITAPDCGDASPIAGLTSCASAFQITGSAPSPVPEPRGYVTLFGVGALCLAAGMRRSHNRQCHS